MFSTILHPTDLSEASAAAHRTAHELAKALGAKLIVCYITHPPLVASGTDVTDPETGKTRFVLEEVQAVQPPDPAVDCDVRIVMTDRSASAKTILGTLEKLGCDLIVLGMHKRSGVSGWMGSSITEEVVRHANTPVMIVKATKKTQKAPKQ